MADAVEESAVKQHVAIFKFQFPKSSQAQNSGRAQLPLKPNQGSTKLTPLLLELAPLGGQDMIKTAPAALKFDSTSLFGFVADMQYFGVEYLGLCNVRYTLKGDREVFIGRFGDLFRVWENYGGKGKEYPATMKIHERVGAFFKEANVDVIKAMEESGIILRRGTAHAGNAIVIRPGPCRYM